jgi:hypothetical protein
MWQRVQVMKLLLVHFSPPSYYIIPLRPVYSPQHGSQIPAVCVPTSMSKSNFHTHKKNYRKNYSFVYHFVTADSITKM